MSKIRFIRSLANRIFQPWVHPGRRPAGLLHNFISSDFISADSISSTSISPPRVRRPPAALDPPLHHLPRRSRGRRFADRPVRGHLEGVLTALHEDKGQTRSIDFLCTSLLAMGTDFLNLGRSARREINEIQVRQVDHSFFYSPLQKFPPVDGWMASPENFP